MKRCAYIVCCLTICSMTSFAQSLLWEITGNELEQPSYIFGTIHIQDKRVFEFNDSLPAKLEQVDQLALELDMSNENMMKMAMLFMLKDGKTLKDVVSAEAYEKLSKLIVSELGNLALYEKMTPFASISMLMQTKIAKDAAVPVDLFLYQKAQAMDKPCIGIETMEEQAALFEYLTDKDIIEFCDEFDTYDNELEDLIQAYVDADLDIVQKLMDEQDSYSDEFMEKLLDDRNKVMAERIGPIIQEKSTFIAIGAGHLKGESGVIDLLEKQGYEIKPILAGKSYLPE